MSTKSLNYTHQSLAACGFAVMTPAIAWKLRPDLWASGQDCAMGLRTPNAIEGVQRMTVKLAGIGSVLVLTRNADQLAQRIEWVTGCTVESMEVEKAPAEKGAAEDPRDIFQRREAEREAKVRELAAQQLPAHDCALRKDILAARAELERLAA